MRKNKPEISDLSLRVTRAWKFFFFIVFSICAQEVKKTLPQVRLIE